VPSIVEVATPCRFLAAHLIAMRSHVIHTVGPKFSEKYRTAAENALHSCYRSCLSLVVESGLRTIAFPCINTSRKMYPREDAAHIAIRTLHCGTRRVHSVVLTVHVLQDLCDDSLSILVTTST